MHAQDQSVPLDKICAVAHDVFCLQYGIMLFFAAWCLIMTAYVILCLPETKGVPIEEIVVVWRKHWLWKRFVQPAAVDLNGGGAQSVKIMSMNSDRVN